MSTSRLLSQLPDELTSQIISLTAVPRFSTDQNTPGLRTPSLGKCKHINKAFEAESSRLGGRLESQSDSGILLILLTSNLRIRPPAGSEDEAIWWAISEGSVHTLIFPFSPEPHTTEQGPRAMTPWLASLHRSIKVLRHAIYEMDSTRSIKNVVLDDRFQCIPEASDPDWMRDIDLRDIHDRFDLRHDFMEVLCSARPDVRLHSRSTGMYGKSFREMKPEKLPLQLTICGCSLKEVLDACDHYTHPRQWSEGRFDHVYSIDCAGIGNDLSESAKAEVSAAFGRFCLARARMMTFATEPSHTTVYIYDSGDPSSTNPGTSWEMRGVLEKGLQTVRDHFDRDTISLHFGPVPEEPYTVARGAVAES